MQEVTLSAVLQKSTTHEDPEVRRLLELASSHLEALRELDRRYSEDGFYNSVKEVSNFKSSQVHNVGFIFRAMGYRSPYFFMLLSFQQASGSSFSP